MSLSDRVLESMMKYRDSRVSEEMKKKEQEEKTGKPTGWNKNIYNTVFFWSFDILCREFNSPCDDMKAALKFLVESDKIKNHEKYTVCYYLTM